MRSCNSRVLLTKAHIILFLCTRALDKSNNISYFSFKLYVVNPHLNWLVETVQMRGHNICFYTELTKIIPNYHQIFLLF